MAGGDSFKNVDDNFKDEDEDEISTESGSEIEEDNVPESFEQSTDQVTVPEEQRDLFVSNLDSFNQEENLNIFKTLQTNVKLSISDNNQRLLISNQQPSSCCKEKKKKKDILYPSISRHQLDRIRQDNICIKVYAVVAEIPDNVAGHIMMDVNLPPEFPLQQFNDMILVGDMVDAAEAEEEHNPADPEEGEDNNGENDE